MGDLIELADYRGGHPVALPVGSAVPELQHPSNNDDTEQLVRDDSAPMVIYRNRRFTENLGLIMEVFRGLGPQAAVEDAVVFVGKIAQLRSESGATFTATDRNGVPTSLEPLIDMFFDDATRPR
jgi:hypothetical protein